MEEEKYWNKFLQGGKIEDYLKFTAARQKREVSEGGYHAVYNRGVGYKGNECGRTRPFSNTPHS